MFYTKYRPQKFSEVIKPNEATEALAKEVKNGKTVHAYLFVGSRGTGKTTVARILAKALNCKKLKDDGDPCDKCESCLAIKNGSFADLIEIDAASNRGIDDIRDLKDKVRLAPSRGSKKVYIIDEVHMLTAEAFNALLKTLEEPPRNVVFILCTTESHKVPETIKSRCQVFRFRRATVTQIINKLKMIAKQEEITINESDLQKIAKISMGGFRDAETLFQQVAEGELDIQSLLSIGSRDTYSEFVNNLIDQEPSKAIKTINKVFEEGADLNLWSGELLKYLRELLFVKSGAIKLIEDLDEELAEKIQKQADSVKTDWLINALNKLMEAQKEVKGSSIPQLPLEIFITDISLGDDDSDDKTKEVSGVPGSVAKVIKKQDKEINEEDHKHDGRVNIADIEEENEDEEISEDDKTDHYDPGVPLTMETVEEKWKEVLKRSKDLNHSITTLLKSGKPTSLDGKLLIFEVSYPFHKERLESHKNRELIEGLLKDIYGVSVKIKCILCKEKPKSKYKNPAALTDYNVSMPPLESGSLLDVFDGGLPRVT